MKLFRIALPLACSLTLASCGFFVEEDEPEVFPRAADVYEGLYSQGFEDSVFSPCGLDEDWLLVADDSTFSAFTRRVVDVLDENPIYVRLEGTPSEPGTYRGFMITYDRRFTLTDVEEVRGRREGDCS